MGFQNDTLHKTKDDEKRDKQRKRKRRAKHLASIDDPKKLKKEMRGLKGGQKRKIKRLSERYKRQEERRNKNRAERLQRRKQRELDKKGLPTTSKKDNKEVKDPSARGLMDKYGKKQPEDLSMGFRKRTQLKTKIFMMKFKNKTKKAAKSVWNWLAVLTGGSSVIFFMLASFVAFLMIAGGIISIMLSHPVAIQELAEQNMLGNALNIGNVSEDVFDKEGNLLVKGTSNATDGGFLWYGKSADSNGGTAKEEDKETPTGNNGLVGSNYEEQIWNYLKGLGFSEAATAGIMGNFMQESGLNPKAIQGGGKGPGTGLAQWENSNGGGGRWDNLVAWAKTNGNRDVWAVDTQIDFMWHEITSDTWQQNMFGKMYKKRGKDAGTGMASVNYFKKEEDPITAMYVFEEAFERAGTPAYANRIKYTTTIYDKYANK